ncbi:hypothetical protein [Phyllobacterium zundukense]|uniref:Uncharacterized protein n=2 Tax=Phyllobacterium zundukense TaxID=1867719 RepID=A0ACD4CYF4_9HYPH|nr:hypothetical protein [Phyllobacterium zundukense]UXN58417.1 hypothetical protein N8E88_10230 [Phyllobacterium zundukense]UXN58559.1 hypothetical protein N8E88_11115 [Phyllobacterium zundukense]
MTDGNSVDCVQSTSMSNGDNRQEMGRKMCFYKSSIPILAAAVFVAATGPVFATVKNQAESTEVGNRKFEQAAMMEARASICGTDEASDTAMRAGMRETGLPEDTAVEIVSDLASGIIDKAQESGSKKICGKAKVQLSGF